MITNTLLQNELRHIIANALRNHLGSSSRNRITLGTGESHTRLSGWYSKSRVYQLQTQAGHIRSFTSFGSARASYRRFGEPPRTSPRPAPRILGFRLPPRGGSSSFDRTFRAIPNWVWWLAGGSGVYYLGHLEKVEQTGRWRFMDTSVESELAVRRSIR